MESLIIEEFIGMLLAAALLDCAAPFGGLDAMGAFRDAVALPPNSACPGLHFPSLRAFFRSGATAGDGDRKIRLGSCETATKAALGERWIPAFFCSIGVLVGRLAREVIEGNGGFSLFAMGDFRHTKSWRN